jgi:flagellar FliL protein
MTAAPPPNATEKKPGGKKKLLIPLMALLLLVGIGAGGWFSGIIPKLLGKGGDTAEHAAEAAHDAAPAAAHAAAAAPAHGAPAARGAKAEEKPAASAHGASAKPEAPADPMFMDLPDIVANLSTGPRRPTFVKLKAKLELARPEDRVALTAALPRVLDLFQGYLREMRPEELRGTAGTYRLREELMARTNLAAPPARVVAVLFTEMIVQ